MNDFKNVAGIVTVYRKNSHADVILGKILEGFEQDGGPGPKLKLVSLYVDQFPAADMSRELARKHGFRIFNSISGAVTLDEKRIAVDGVLCIGEHGEYPVNAKGQTEYPRRRFVESVLATFLKYNRSVPLFNDKHLGYSWVDAKWMVDNARQLFTPFLAGSSLPVAWRLPPLSLPKNCELTGAVQLAYGPLEAYGFHALEALQCMVERRKGGETGVKAVQCLQGEAMWTALDKERWAGPLLEAALAKLPNRGAGDYRKVMTATKDAAIFLLEYRDGFRAAVVMMNGYARGDSESFAFATQFKGQNSPVATQFYLQPVAPYGHFAYLVKAIEATIQTGHAVYPVERTLLTTGVLDALMTSRAEKNRRVETLYLEVRYTPTEWPFAPEPIPAKKKV